LFWRIFNAKVRSAVVHETFYTSKYDLKGPVVTTIHDMIDELYPDRPTAVPANAKRTSCHRARKIIATSNNTKNDLVRLFDIPAEKIAVIYHGDSLIEIEPTAPQCEKDQPYLLCIGARSHYKNFDLVLKAFASSSFLRRNFNLIAFGGGRFNHAEQTLLTEYRVLDKIRYAEGGDQDLVRYYRDAAALIYPSLYEGFGLPILEAMGQGCPVICSNPGGSVPEIAADAAAYFDGGDIDSIRFVIESTIESPSRLQELKRKGYARHQMFSWDKCARETLNVYREVAE
jgi:glycosyltransferase involved in cell wall biosynthesis